MKHPGTPFLHKTKHLRQVRRPHQGYYMSYKTPRKVILAETALLVAAGQTPTGLIHLIKSCECHSARKEAPAAARATSTELIHVVESHECHFVPRKETRAAAAKTSAGLIHVIELRKIGFAGKRTHSYRNEFNRANSCHKFSRTPVSFQKKCAWPPGRHRQQYHFAASGQRLPPLRPTRMFRCLRGCLAKE